MYFMKSTSDSTYLAKAINRDLNRNVRSYFGEREIIQRNIAMALKSHTYVPVESNSYYYEI